VNVYLTVDTEVWPVHSGGWPHKPLQADYDCSREVSAYYFGQTRDGEYGLPYQLRVLNRHGVRATFFVDPLFSFALGLNVLREVVQIIESAGQRIALHLHPEWLTDPRCCGLPGFRGPFISQYQEQEQRDLIRAGMRRLREAGADPLASFRAGSWGADTSTLRALRQEGIGIDSSLNAAFGNSLPSLPRRVEKQEPFEHDGVTVFPVTRIDDRVTQRGRPLSVTGTSWSEMHFALRACMRSGRENFVLVMHSNEFVKTERLWHQRPVVPRRMAIGRFERLCGFLEANRDRLTTRTLAPHELPRLPDDASPALARSSILRTAARMGGQFLSRWY